MSWSSTRDKHYGFHVKSNVEFNETFYKNIVATDIDKFKQLCSALKKSKNPLLNRNKKNLKNSLNIRSKISTLKNNKSERLSELNEYGVFTLLAISNRHQ